MADSKDNVLSFADSRDRRELVALRDLQRAVDARVAELERRPKQRRR